MAAPGVAGLNPEIERHFHAAADLEPDARRRYFDEQGVDEATRAAVERLIGFDRSSARVLGTPLASVAARIEQSAPDYVGPYRLVREIGRGGMGAVYEGERSDGELRLRVAVKFVSRAIRSDFIVERFKRERQILANLNHPNICRVIDAGTTEDGLPYLVMELIEGQTVDEWARGRSPAEICRLFRQVCEAVQHAHQNLVVHRDLKPGNILVTASGEPKLLDFGIAKLLDNVPSGEQNTIRALTPAYAAPEQVAGQAVTTAADLYGLGCVLYHLLTGAAPKRQPGEEIPAVSTVRPELRRYDAAIQRATRQEPRERYGTAREFGEALEAPPRTKKNWWWPGIAAVFGLLAAVFGLLAAVAWVRPRPDDGEMTKAISEGLPALRAVVRKQAERSPLLAAEALRTLGDYDGAAEVLKGIEHPEAAELRGQVALDRGDLEAAARSASGLAAAEANRRLGRLEAATRAIAGREDAAAAYERSRILEDTGQVTQALEEAKRLPNERRYQRRLAQLLELAGERERARKEYEAIVNRLDPAALSPRERGERIADFLRAGRVAEATGAAASLVSDFPRDRYAQWAQARAWGAQPATRPQADGVYLRLLEAAPQDADLLREFAANRIALGCGGGGSRLDSSPHPAIALLRRQLQQVCESR
ncbi:MAG: protein kinase [Bryobacteraceae bacterium]|nr:protein kinase [Bryobacteraceae bacterium]